MSKVLTIWRLSSDRAPPATDRASESRAHPASSMKPTTFTRRADGQWSLIPGETTDPIIAPIGVHDLAKAVRLALGNDETVGEVYNAVGSEAVSWPEMLRTARDATPGAKKTIQPGGIPAPAAALAAMKMKFFGMGNLLPFDAGMAAMGAEDSTASLEKFEAHFGFVPGSYEGALREAVAGA